MIPIAFVTEWRNIAPWKEDVQVEQDLIISRSLTAIFNDAFLKEKLAFRGGTALHKIYFKTPLRYSEDIDLVQVNKEPIGPIIDHLRSCLQFIGKPQIKQSNHNNTLLFSIESSFGPKIKLKVEINTREQFVIKGFQYIPYSVESSWHKSEAIIKTFFLEELLATKLRALYQRKKGRDLFDLFYAIKNTSCDMQQIVTIWKKYMIAEGSVVTKEVFRQNLIEKTNSLTFTNDLNMIIKEGYLYDFKHAYLEIVSNLIELI